MNHIIRTFYKILRGWIFSHNNVGFLVLEDGSVNTDNVNSVELEFITELLGVLFIYKKGTAKLVCEHSMG